MKILNYISSLLPSFDRQRILNHITQMQGDLSGVTLKSFKDAGELFARKKFQAKVNQEFDKNYHSVMRDTKSVNFVLAIENVLKGLPAKLSFLESLVSSDFSKDVARDALTYKKATVLKYLDVCDFVLVYSNRLLLNAIAAETYQNNGQADMIGSDQVPAMAKWMAQNENAYLRAMKVLAMPLNETKEKIESIPEITVVPDNADHIGAVKETVGETKLDPMGLGFLITTWANPIYKLRMAFAEWQVERYKAKQEEKRALEYRLLALRESYEKKQDPKLQQNIQYSQGRLQNLNHRLSELESEYGVA